MKSWKHFWWESHRICFFFKVAPCLAWDLGSKIHHWRKTQALPAASAKRWRWMALWPGGPCRAHAGPNFWILFGEVFPDSQQKRSSNSRMPLVLLIFGEIFACELGWTYQTRETSRLLSGILTTEPGPLLVPWEERASWLRSLEISGQSCISIFRSQPTLARMPRMPVAN